MTVRDRETKRPVAGAKVSVKGTGISATTGDDGVPDGEQTVEMAYPTDVTPELLERAYACVAKVYREGCEFKKAGVLLTGLVPAGPTIVRMYGDGEWQGVRRLARALDDLNERFSLRFGRAAVTYGVACSGREWKSKPETGWEGKSEKRSPRYATRWGEPKTVGRRLT